jgi:hypothetical protein
MPRDTVPCIYNTGFSLCDSIVRLSPSNSPINRGQLPFSSHVLSILIRRCCITGSL